MEAKMKFNRNKFERKSTILIFFKYFIFTVSFLASTAICFAAETMQESGILNMVPESFSGVAKKAGPAVVNIRTEKTIKNGGQVYRYFYNGPQREDDPDRDSYKKYNNNPHHQEYKQQSLGSGFIIDEDGYIVTNYHVVKNSDKIKVILQNGSEVDGEIVGRDPNTDLALIKIQSKDKLQALKFGDSDSINIGEWVLAAGNPFGLMNTVTAGIISAKGRVIGSGLYDDFIQTDASINPGNSGGPLLNMAGEVIGINTAIVDGGQGIGFAIPVNMAKPIVEQLINDGEVTRGWMGVVIQDMNKDLADYYGTKDTLGALVSDVIQGDPADIAGIKHGDLIVAIDGQLVENSRDLIKKIAVIPVGKIVIVSVVRKGNPNTYNVKIGKRNEMNLTARGSGTGLEEKLGIRLTELTQEIANQFNLSASDGIIVSGVAPQSKAAEAGFEVGDLIKEINTRPIMSIQDFNNVFNETNSGELIRILIYRLNAGVMIIEMTK